MRLAFILAVLFCSVPLVAAEVKVSDAEAARQAVREAKPGDVVILAAGEWKDVDLRLDGEGTAEEPITIRAEAPGKALFTGASRIRLGGEHLVVSGLHLMGLAGTKADWLEFRIDSKRRANFCRVTDCFFSEGAESSVAEPENRWIGIYGEGNQVDHCTISGKKNKGATLVVWLGEKDPGRHRILANLFRDRPRLGTNGGETIRLGDSKTSMRKAECLVEGNYFTNCDGEAECISNKSCGNIYRGNWFVDTQGTLTLRHGNDCLVESNVFVGGKRGGTGGVRVIGSGHRIIGNFFNNLEGEGFRSALCLVNGIPDSPASGYHQVLDAEIRGNLFYRCREAILIGYNDVKEATLPPKRIRFEDNRIFAMDSRPAVRVDLAPLEVVWKGNLYMVGDLIGMEEVAGLTRELFADPSLPEVPSMVNFGITWVKFPR